MTSLVSCDYSHFINKKMQEPYLLKIPEYAERLPDSKLGLLLQIFMPFLDLTLDYIGIFITLASGTIPATLSLAWAMLLNVIVTPCIAAMTTRSQPLEHKIRLTIKKIYLPGWLTTPIYVFFGWAMILAEEVYASKRLLISSSKMRVLKNDLRNSSNWPPKFDDLNKKDKLIT